jgi:cytochrome oxidase Cu insertion factor (SCO1/SenC/PrrC family)
LGTDLALRWIVRALMVGLFLVTGIGHAEQVLLRGQDAHGRWFDLSSLRGRMVVITFGSRHTEKRARAINDRLAKSALVVNVVDLRGVPDIAHKLALQKIRESDRDQMRHLVDENGEIARGFDADTRHHVDMLIVDRRGRLVGRYTDEAQLPEAEAKLHRVAARGAPKRVRR